MSTAINMPDSSDSAAEEDDDDSMEPESSEAPYSTDDEHSDRDADERLRAFLSLVQSSRVSAVRQRLNAYGDEFDANRKNYLGLTALSVAVQEGCEPIVDLLLARAGVEIGDSLMHAICRGRDAIAEKLLDAVQARHPERVKLGYDSTEFPRHLTPIMLAAQCGNFKMIRLLLSRGHTIETPHKPRCLCKKVCMSKAILKNRLGAAEEKLSVFRALSNPSYVLLTSADPVLAAFRLSKLLRQHGAANREMETEYAGLDAAVRMFAVRLVGLCSTSAEVKQILSRKEGCSFFGAFPYTRLVMAMDLKQKEFVAHAYVQQTLQGLWADEWHDWRRYGTARKFGHALLRVPLLPWAVVMTLVLPLTRTGRWYVAPVNRMLSYVASYALYLAAVTAENNYADNATWPRDAAFSWSLKAVIAVYALSFAVRACKLALVQGPARYFRVLWNVYDCAKLALLAGAVACWWLTYRASPRRAADADGGPPERKYLRSADPVLVADGLLAVATVMSYLRLLFLCQLNFVLGPMQVSLGKMTIDFVRFAVLFAIIIVAFVAGTCRLYQYYEGMSRTDPVTGAEQTQDPSFVSTADALKTLFWSIFCMAPATAGRVVIGGGGGGGGGSTAAGGDDDDEDGRGGFDEPVADSHYFTQLVGTTLFAVFAVVAVFIMLNMLIATMSNTYQRVTDNAHVEWVFGQTQVYVSFCVHAEPPPPFNLLPSFHCSADAFRCLGNCFKAGAHGLANIVSGRGVGHTAEDQHSEQEFKELMAKLGRRYYRSTLQTIASSVDPLDPIARAS